MAVAVAAMVHPEIILIFRRTIFLVNIELHALKTVAGGHIGLWAAQWGGASKAPSRMGVVGNKECGCLIQTLIGNGRLCVECSHFENGSSF